MTRILIRMTASCIFVLFTLAAQGCGITQDTVDTEWNEPQQLFFSLAVEPATDERLAQAPVLIAIPAIKELREIREPWISATVISLLSEESRERLAHGGILHVENSRLTKEILMTAGMSTIAAGDIWITVSEISWSCLKSCYAPRPGCEPCPDCCDKNKDKIIDFELTTP